MPATIAIGTARISGHGVATTRTESARIGSPVASQAPPAMTNVMGMNHNAYWSARRTAGAFSSSAASTSRTMPAYVESAAVAVACRSNAGPALTAPERTRSPEGRSTGRDSPVSADSSRIASPSSTPSTGTTSPVFTKSRSASTTSSMSRVRRSPSS